jgi:hypothetical protein
MNNSGASTRSGFKFSPFRASKKNKSAPGRRGRIRTSMEKFVTRRSKRGKVIVAASVHLQDEGWEAEGVFVLKPQDSVRIHNGKIESKQPVRDVIYSIFDVLSERFIAPSTVHSSPTGEADFQKMTQAVITFELHEF